MKTPHAPSMRDIARRAGASVSAVSLALRGSPKVSPERRAAIARAAEALGYRRNALVASLMNQVRRGGMAREACPVLAFVQPRGPHEDHPYITQTWEGARRAAEQTGYRLERFHWEEAADPGALARMLYHRGYSGAIIQAKPEGVELERDWKRLCLVGIERDRRAPALDYVAHHHFRSMVTVLERCRDAGLLRVGFAHGLRHAGLDSHYEWLGALRACAAEFGVEAGFLPLSASEKDPPAVKRWVAGERFDAVIGVSPYVRRLLPANPGPGAASSRPCFINLDLDLSEAGARQRGIVQDHREIGAAALTFLSAKVERNETGLGPVAHALLIEGRWHGTLPSRAKRGRAPASTEPL